jgi:hypothetical protein
MTAQTTLTAFSLPQLALPCANSCEDCVTREGPIQVIGGKLKVKCLGTLRDARTGCSSWSDGKELEYLDSFRPPPGFVPKKWRGQA